MRFCVGVMDVPDSAAPIMSRQMRMQLASLRGMMRPS